MNENQTKVGLLVIDDDPIYRNLLRSILKERFDVFAVEKPSIGFKILENESIEFVISDFKLPEMDGLRVLEKIKEQYPSIEVILISNSGDMDTVISALRKGAADYFKKPFSAAEIWTSIERTERFKILNNDLREVKMQNTRLKSRIQTSENIQIIGNSTSINQIKEQMTMVAQTPDTSVLILGESGTGKELVARGIHALSARSDEPFGAVNMAAVPESLFESEFFGHKKGSFTGAVADKAGWFETAHKGTLFFDEVGEMSLALQVKMLRVLEDRKFTRVGAQKEQPFDVRVVAATNKTVQELSNGKDFRLDLFHRLGTFIIHLAPLRERKSDIPELAQYFLDELTKKMGRNINAIHPDAIQKLLQYNFPGNIRELRNFIERAIIMCKGDMLLPENFILSGLDFSTAIAQEQHVSEEIFDLAQIEKQTIERVLKMVNYNKAEAARLLNLEWNALYRRISKFKIKMP